MGERISEAIGIDHRYLDHCYDRIKDAADLEVKTQWRNQLVWTLARHAISEELTMYPAMEKHLGQEGVKLTDEDRAQHQAVKEDLFSLQDMSPEDTNFDPLLERLMKDLYNHIEHEQNEDMPRLEGKLTQEESEELARQFQRTKLMTPTRSHPSAPSKPYLENIVALLAAPIDKIMDWTRTFPQDA